MYDWCLLGYVLVLDYLFMCLMMSTKCCLWSVLEMSSRYYLVWLATRIEGMLTSPVCGLLGEKKNQIPSKDERKVEMAKQESSQLTGSIDGDLHVTSMVLHQRFLWASMHLLLTKSFSERREKEMREELAHAHLCVACWEKIQIVASKERVKKAEPTVVGLQAKRFPVACQARCLQKVQAERRGQQRGFVASGSFCIWTLSGGFM